MDRLRNIASQPSQSHSRLSSHPFASTSAGARHFWGPSPQKSQAPASFNYWSYFVDPDPDISIWKRVGAGAALPIVGPLTLFTACDGSVDSGTRPSVAAEKMDGFQRIIRSDSYAGRLIVFLESGDQINVLNEVVRNYSGVKIERSVSRTTEEENRRRQELETRTGKKFLDWNRVYYVDVRDKNSAGRLISELMATPEVRLVYPEQIKHGPSLATTPNLEGLQTYLSDSSSAGLNITYAWEQGVYGAGVMVADGDSGINFEHEEFDLERRSPSSGGNSWGADCTPETADDPLYFCTSSNVAHGTATMGMLHARHGAEDDRHGIRGIVPEAWATYPVSNSMPSGSIALFECATQYSWDGTVTCNEGASGLACVPCISSPGDYALGRETVFGRDITSIMTAGNGAIDLDETQLIDDETMEEICGGPASDPQAADCWETSGDILVGASQGDRDMVSGQPQKQSYSNCGEDVELFGWGERVVTTSWHPESGPLSNYEWVDDGEALDPPNDEVNAYFTNEFGGTSAAAAMVAGAATLVQSYFKDISGGNPQSSGSELLTRYLMPWKMKEILVNSGVSAYSADGCGIGKQPQMDVAMSLVDDFWENEILPAFPELVDGQLESTDRLYELHALGMGLGFGDLSNPPIIIPPRDCGPQDGSYTQACIDEEIVPHLSKKMDIDEDGRGDLISWTRGNWKIDLSTGEPADPECGTEDNPPCPEINDNYGAWDLELSYPPVSNWEVPVVMDYDSDGQADLAIYDRQNGQWNIAVTGAALLSGEWGGWTHTVDWPGIGDSDDYEDMWYTRPLPADYNGDDWTDLAVQTSDGHWQINFDWRNAEEGWSGRRFEEYGPLVPSYADSSGIKDLAYLTDEELEAYPGWAYLPSVGTIHIASDLVYLGWRGPEGIVNVVHPSGLDRASFEEVGTFLGGIEDVSIVGAFQSSLENVGAKTNDGLWQYHSRNRGEVITVDVPAGTFGDIECRPFISDLDGDSRDDCTVMCPEGWRVIYSASTFASQNDEDGIRRVPLGYTDSASLPGQPVFGGLSYERVEQVRDYMYNLGLTNIPPLFDYAMIPYEYCDLPWFVGEMPEECR